MENFTLQEMIASPTAARLKIDNTPTAAVRAHLTETIGLLEDIRMEWGLYCEEWGLGTAALKVTSGYRCPALNKAVGGVKTSAHVAGYAADLVPVNGMQDEFEEFMSQVFAGKGYAYDQIIVEKSKASRWVHVGYKSPDGRQRRECFKLKV